ncbi:RING finger protein B [Ceratocystis fimbriata CBS 114723]|uniref:RING finger protein B n=1 Tax=Ceratocystis fimbriata CBS 114723 TaxID=1035309 RepID=A0A2C5X9N0_9PEZI|nr:RING finger protein B [Ceratocystis fimbriata CBS 114723]
MAEPLRSIPVTPSGGASSPHHSHPHAYLLPDPNSAMDTSVPGSSSSSNTYVMSNSAAKTWPALTESYRPKVIRTDGQRPACLVNASVTYCGNNQIYAFGGFDQYTDEVYNHVLCLNLTNQQWRLVDNYGDIPGVRMGHTATLYQGDKLLVFGGENEHRTYLSDLIIFDLKTAHWRKPQVNGHIPKGRARHAAVLHEDKLFVIGGITGRDNYVLDDICYLDLKTFTWSRSWRFVARFDHSAYIWNDRVWVFGGLSDAMDKSGDLWWLDLKGNPAFQSPPQIGAERRPTAGCANNRGQFSIPTAPVVGSSGYAANSRTAQVNPPSFQLKGYAPPAPGAISSLKFVSGGTIPLQSQGSHFHVYSAGTLLDFQTPAATMISNLCTLSALDLGSLRWQKLAQGNEVYKAGYRWHYCTMNEEGTKAWLLGCESDMEMGVSPTGLEEFLSDIMEIDLRRYGFLGTQAESEISHETRPAFTSRAICDKPSKGLGSDLATIFDSPPESGSGADFIVTATADEAEDVDMISTGAGPCDEQDWLAAEAPVSPPIHVHRLILQARWPYFSRLYNSQMAEFHTKKMHIPEPYTVVRAFLLYLYTDSIMGGGSEASAPALSTVAGLLVMSDMYGISHLRHLCVNRLGKELDVAHACIIWYSAGIANEDWLRKRAAQFCLEHWGRVVRSDGFMKLPRMALVDLSQEVDTEGRVLGGDEAEQPASSVFIMLDMTTYDSQ